MEPDVFIICHSHRQVPHLKRAAPYRPLVGAGLAVGTLTSKRLDSLFYHFSPHGRRKCVYTGLEH